VQEPQLWPCAVRACVGANVGLGGIAHHVGAAVGGAECAVPSSSTGSTPCDGAHDQSPARCGRYVGAGVPMGNGSNDGAGVIAARAASALAASKRTR
jgi:hypothetical protein